MTEREETGASAIIALQLQVLQNLKMIINFRFPFWYLSLFIYACSLCLHVLEKD